jgi:hypothetical protein
MHGRGHIVACPLQCGAANGAFVGIGTNEDDMNELRIFQIIAISFCILWAFSLGLNLFG